MTWKIGTGAGGVGKLGMEVGGGLARGLARAGQVSSEEVCSSAENRKRKDGETI